MTSELVIAYSVDDSGVGAGSQHRLCIEIHRGLSVARVRVRVGVGVGARVRVRV